MLAASSRKRHYICLYGLPRTSTHCQKCVEGQMVNCTGPPRLGERPIVVGDLGGDAADEWFRRVPARIDRFLSFRRRALRLCAVQVAGSRDLKCVERARLPRRCGALARAGWRAPDCAGLECARRRQPRLAFPAASLSLAGGGISWSSCPLIARGNMERCYGMAASRRPSISLSSATAMCERPEPAPGFPARAPWRR